MVALMELTAQECMQQNDAVRVEVNIANIRKISKKVDNLLNVISSPSLLIAES